MPVNSVQDIRSVLEMLDDCLKVGHAATAAYNNLKAHPAYQNEGLPELLRAQSQNAVALVVQAKKIWQFMLDELEHGQRAGPQTTH